MAAARGQARALLVDLRRIQRDAVALTQREPEVVGMLAKGRSNREIAESLVVSERTVESQVANLLGKLGLANRAQAAAWAGRDCTRAGQQPGGGRLLQSARARSASSLLSSEISA
jgi:DNA-binding NarL/FixJ family response regulator